MVKGDTAELRPVIAGIEYEGLTVIEKGVAPDEQVVTDGQVRIVPGGKIAIKQPQGAGNNEQGAKSMGQNQQPEAPAKDKAK